MSLKIRTARSDDITAIGALLAELGGGRPPLPDDPRALAPVRAVYERHLARAAERQAFLYVAELEGRIVGVLSADVRERLNQPTPEVWVADLVVTEAARGRGVGKALLDRVEADARSIGARNVCLESGQWRKDAHRFYAREGYRDLALFFLKEIAP